MAWTKVGNLTPDIVGGGEAPWVVDPYVRPADWLPLPAVNVGQQKFVGLLAVFDNGTNFCALTVAGAYTVDWGDGTSNNMATGTTAYHQYTYSSIPANTTTSLGYRQVIVTITPQGAGNLTSVNVGVKHNQAGMSSVSPNWLDIRLSGPNLTSITFGALTPAGAKFLEQIEFIGTNNVVSIGNMFTGCTALRRLIGKKLLDKVSAVILSGITAVAELDLDISSATSFSMNASNYTLQKVTLGRTAPNCNFNIAFQYCYNLREVHLDMTNVSNATSMFDSCSNLSTVDIVTSSALTTTTSMFTGCTGLKTVPLFDTSGVTAANSMFNGCSALLEVPPFDFRSATTMANAFTGCRSITSVPDFNLAACTSFANMFTSCYSLKTIPLFNSSNVTAFNNMFGSCFSLSSVPLLDTSKGTTFVSMFSSCARLQTVPAFDTSKATTVSGMFNGCASLKSIPVLNTGLVITFDNMFSGCAALIEVPALNMTSASTTTTMFNNCVNLARIAAYGCSKTISVTGCMLSGTALNEIYTNLASGVTGQTITVTTNIGTATDDPTIATAKGWTVTGS